MLIIFVSISISIDTWTSPEGEYALYGQIFLELFSAGSRILSCGADLCSTLPFSSNKATTPGLLGYDSKMLYFLSSTLSSP